MTRELSRRGDRAVWDAASHRKVLVRNLQAAREILGSEYKVWQRFLGDREEADFFCPSLAEVHSAEARYLESVEKVEGLEAELASLNEVIDETREDEGRDAARVRHAEG